MRNLIINNKKYDISDENKIIEVKDGDVLLSRDDKNEVNISDSTELGEALKKINKDDINPVTKISAIDMRARLFYSEIAGILSIDSLVGFRVLPKECLDFTIRKKRLSVSLDGKGRGEIVKMVIGDREQKSGMGAGDRMKSFLGLNKQP